MNRVQDRGTGPGCAKRAARCPGGLPRTPRPTPRSDRQGLPYRIDSKETHTFPAWLVPHSDTRNIGIRFPPSAVVDAFARPPSLTDHRLPRRSRQGPPARPAPPGAHPGGGARAAPRCRTRTGGASTGSPRSRTASTHAGNLDCAASPWNTRPEPDNPVRDSDSRPIRRRFTIVPGCEGRPRARSECGP